MEQKEIISVAFWFYDKDEWKTPAPHGQGVEPYRLQGRDSRTMATARRDFAHHAVHDPAISGKVQNLRKVPR